MTEIDVSLITLTTKITYNYEAKKIKYKLKTTFIKTAATASSIVTALRVSLGLIIPYELMMGWQIIKLKMKGVNWILGTTLPYLPNYSMNFGKCFGHIHPERPPQPKHIGNECFIKMSECNKIS